jgi:PRTRC genetic system ThiF family protein
MIIGRCEVEKEGINVDYVRARRLMLPAVERVSLTLVGCGGTGSWLAPSVARVGRLIMERLGREVVISFVDGDQVEEKNCFRQNFCRAEVGRNKAEALAFRYGLAWGVEISAHATRVEEFRRLGGSDELLVYVGCVDNAAARREIRMRVKDGSRSWWLDCGNEKSSGQVLLGGGGKKPKDAFVFEGLCTWLPLPSEQAPDLLEGKASVSIETAAMTSTERGLSSPTERGLSCADLAMVDSQGMAINQRVAAEATDYLVRMLLTQDLTRYATYIDLGAGSSRSKYILPEEVRR